MDEFHRTSIFPKLIICFSIIVWALTEILSVFHMLTSNNIKSIWCILGTLLFVFIVIWARKKHFNLKMFLYGQRDLLAKSKREGQWFERILIVACFVLAFGMFYLSSLIVPNNWDSMTYHLARVANWIQNASIEYYPTNIPRQLYYSSFTEYFILHLCLFFKNDQLVNCVQWFGYMCSAVMIYKISLRLNTGKIGAIFSALLFMMCPLAIAESVTTQTDLMATMWAVIYAYFILVIGQASYSLLHRNNLFNVSLCACSIGFAWLTKSGVCFIMPLFLLWLFIVCVKKKESWSAILRCMVIAVVLIVILAFPGFVRNYKSTGNILAFEQMAGNLLIKTGNPKLLLLNACKNLTLEMGGSAESNPVWGITIKLSEYMGINIEDPEISAYEGFLAMRGCIKNYHHDTAGAQMFMVIVGITTALAIAKLCIIFYKRRSKSIIDESYLWILLCEGIVMFILIRWQPWGNRLLLPALALFSIFSGYMISTAIENIYIKTGIILAVLLLLFPDTYGGSKGAST